MKKKPNPVVIDVTDYRVMGEEPVREPVVKSWSGLLWFVGLTVLAVALRAWSFIEAR